MNFVFIKTVDQSSRAVPKMRPRTRGAAVVGNFITLGRARISNSFLDGCPCVTSFHTELFSSGHETRQRSDARNT
jgi:hypothetical protein